MTSLGGGWVGVGVGMKPGAELQCRVSEGVNRVDEKTSRPVAARMSVVIKGPWRGLRRSDMSARSVDRRDGDRRPLMGTQCVEWTSAGCSAKGGMSCLRRRNTKGHRTMRLRTL